MQICHEVDCLFLSLIFNSFIQNSLIGGLWCSQKMLVTLCIAALKCNVCWFSRLNFWTILDVIRCHQMMGTWCMKHGIPTVHSNTPVKGRVCEGLLLKLKFNDFLILPSVTLREYGIPELSRGQKERAPSSCAFGHYSLSLWETDDTSPCS